MPSYSTPLRNAKLDANSTFAGANAKLRIYGGSRPASGGAATTLLAEFTLGATFAPAAVGGVQSPNLPANATGVAAGTATWFRVVKADGTTFVMDGSVGTTGAEINFSTTTVSVGLELALTAWTISGGNV